MPVKKYTTAEEKIAAQVATQKRYYEAHKETLKKRATEWYIANRQTGQPKGRPKKVAA